MHGSGLVYVATFEDVGDEEAQRQNEKSASSQQIKKIAKTLFRMSVAMGLEPLVAETQQCSESKFPSSNGANAWWWILAVVLVIFLAVVCRFFW